MLARASTDLTFYVCHCDASKQGGFFAVESALKTSEEILLQAIGHAAECLNKDPVYIKELEFLYQELARRVATS